MNRAPLADKRPSSIAPERRNPKRCSTRLTLFMPSEQLAVLDCSEENLPPVPRPPDGKTTVAPEVQLDAATARIT